MVTKEQMSDGTNIYYALKVNKREFDISIHVTMTLDKKSIFIIFTESNKENK